MLSECYSNCHTNKCQNMEPIYVISIYVCSYNSYCRHIKYLTVSSLYIVFIVYFKLTNRFLFKTIICSMTGINYQ